MGRGTDGEEELSSPRLAPCRNQGSAEKVIASLISYERSSDGCEGSSFVLSQLSVLAKGGVFPPQERCAKDLSLKVPLRNGRLLVDPKIHQVWDRILDYMDSEIVDG